MRHRTIAGFLSGIAVAGMTFGAFADVTKNPYQMIIARNPFGLRAMNLPETIKLPGPVMTPPREIKLTGITTLAGAAKAFFQVEDKHAKKTDFPAPLAIGESYQEITVLAIDVENNTVRIKSGDAETTLDFVNHGVKPTISALAPNAIPIQSVSRAPAPLAFATPVGALSNNRSIVTGGEQPYDPNRQRPVPPPRIMSREEVEARIELEREIRRQNNDPTHELLPPLSTRRTPKL